MNKSNIGSWLTVFFFSFIFLSCTKHVYVDSNAGDDDSGFIDGNPDETTGKTEDSLKYLMYHIMETSYLDGGRDKKNDLPLYFWYKDVPNFDPFSSAYPKAKDLLNKMISFPKLDGQAIDRYTFLDDGTTVGEIGGDAGDIGIDIAFGLKEEGGSKAYPVVKTVDKNSPAGAAGVKRGWMIETINGADAGVGIKSGNLLDTNDPVLQIIINAIFNDAQASFKFMDLGNNEYNISLNKADYKLNPVLFDTVYNNVAGKKVGYFVFNTFSDIYTSYDKNGQPNGPATLTKQELDRVFSDFSNAGISSLIVDFRYNGGGAGTTAEYLSDYIASSAANGKLMFTQNFNDKINPLFDDDERETYFQKKGNLTDLQNVVFIVTGSTASASEIVINNLKPYMNVKLVGETTYGKPVGSIVTTITMFDKGNEKFLAYLLPIAFDFVNSQGEGHYYSGMKPDAEADDNIFLNWGEVVTTQDGNFVQDEGVVKALNYISNGNFGRMMPGSSMTQSRAVMVRNRGEGKKIPDFRFNGLIDTKNKLNRWLLPQP